MVWEPIETAPKDRGPIIVCDVLAHLYAPQTVWWASYHPNATGQTCWRTSPIGGNKVASATHWMPIPAPPEV